MSSYSDRNRGLEVDARHSNSVPAAGQTLTTGALDGSKMLAIVARAEVDFNQHLSAGLKFEESDDNSTFTDVAAKDYTGGKVDATTGLALAVSTKHSAAIGYQGNKRYVRAAVVIANGSAAAVASREQVLVLIGEPRVTAVR